MEMNRALGLAISGAAALLQSAAPVRSQETIFPKNTPIEITVLFPAGSSPDITARVFGQVLAGHLGAGVMVVNRPGAGGAIGYRHVAGQKPDGHSLVWISGSIATAYHLGLLAFDYAAFEPVARVLVESPLVAVRGDSRWASLGELIAEAKSRPSEITVGNSGRGSDTHISSVALFKSAAVEILEVPFPLAQVVPILLGGHVDALVELPAALSNPVKTGSVRLLAALAPGRDPALPDVPTAQEQGHDVSMEIWRGIAAPRGTSVGVVAVLEAAIRKTVQSPEFVRASGQLGVRPAFMPSIEFAALIDREHRRLGRMMEAVGLTKQP
ncbi:MAG: hypothetical protein A3I00_02670 [Betaproteobacteria bacterium RIFCSPLOWO2_02_FULL_64_12]|nr:MAG: hypothetical protein A3I00_02670 [Betaproteobacteria bacterium RIFCSPLOWO2_02_FULL_64_12]